MSDRSNDDLILEDMTANLAKTDRFWAKLVEDENGCLLWPGKPNNGGYGVFSIGVHGLAFTTSAHRVAWMLENSAVVPPGLEVDHLCRVRLCCNPDHLEPVTRSENTARTYRRTLDGQAAVVSRSKGSVHIRKRVAGDRYLATWREHLADGTTIQRGHVCETRQEAETMLTAAANDGF